MKVSPSLRSLDSRVVAYPRPQEPAPLRGDLTSVGGSWSAARELDDYSATFRSVSGAVGAALGRMGALGAATILGSTVAGTLAAGPLGMAGLCAATYLLGHKIRAKIGPAHSIASRLGEKLGEPIGAWAHKVGVPLKDGLVKMAKGEMTHQTFAESGKVEKAQVRDFVSKLQPGDIILTRLESSASVNAATTLVNGRSDFTHSLIYEGEGRILEAIPKGVVRGDASEAVAGKNHVVAVRPRYYEGQVAEVLASAQAKVGSSYDMQFRLGNDAYYCSELVYEALRDGAPQIEMKSRSLLGQEVILPDDIYETPGSTLVAEVGEHRSLFDRATAKLLRHLPAQHG